MARLAGNVVEVDNHLKEMKEGSMVCVLLKNYKKYPVMGKVLEVKDESFKIHYWQGGYRKQWTPHMVYEKRSRVPFPWSDWLPKSCVILSDFILVNNKLTISQKKYLKDKYIELVNESE